MPMGRPKAELVLSEDERSQLSFDSAFALDLGGAGDACAHRAGCCCRGTQQRNCPASSAHACHRGQVAYPVPGASHQRAV